MFLVLYSVSNIFISRHEDLELSVRCAKGLTSNGRDGIQSFHNATGTSRPIYYLNEGVRRARHLAWQNIVKEEEAKYNTTYV